ncbi:MAG TPA: hypothetical protein VGN09_30360 [Vicinamibacteria bacterium]|jgi:hypothetical protein
MKIDIEVPSQLSDDELLAHVESLARCEREATATLVAHLAELDARRLYLGAGFSSLFGYCCEVLHLSEPAAYNRIEVARTAQRFPAVLPMLAEGLLSLATVRLLVSHLTIENQRELLTEAAGKSKRAVEEMLVRFFPRPEVPSSVRKLPAVKALAESSREPAVALRSSLALAPASPPPPRRPLLSPLTPDRYELRVTVSAETRENLRLAQDLLRHAIPSGDPAQVIDRALKVLVEQLRRKKFAATDRPRASRGTAPGSRDVAAKVRRAVGLRDDGRCTFVGKSGRRCNERAFIEFHHDEPYGVGGEATIGNIQLRCRAHNAYESERFYGRGRPMKSATLPGKSRLLPTSHPQSSPPA